MRLERARGRVAKRKKRRPAPAAIDAEQRLLALARALPTAGPDAVRLLADAYRADGPLPRALAQAWITSPRDKTRALALGWAREQLRLALEQALRGLTTFAEPATLAWLVLAACEALAHEPPAAAADRVAALLELVGGAATR